MQSVRQIKIVYYLAQFLYWFSVAVALPVFVLLMGSRGVDLFQVGIIMGAYSLVIVILELPTGGLADALGRKTVSLLAYSISLLATGVILFSFSFGGFLLATMLSGIGRALSSGALDAWFVDSLKKVDPEIDLQPPLAQAGGIALFALGSGSILGGFLPRLFAWLPAEGTAVLTPLATTQVASAIVLTLLLLVVTLLVAEPDRRRLSYQTVLDGFSAVPAIIGESLQISRQNRTLVLLFAASAAGGFAIIGVESFWQPRFAALSTAGEDTWLLGLIMAVSFLAGMVGNLLSVPLVRRLKGRNAWAATLARSLQGLALIALALQPTIAAAAATFWLVYLSMGLTNAPHATLLNNEIPSSRRSAMLSLESLANYLGAALGGLLLGILAQRVSISSAWLVAGLILMVSLFAYVTIARRQKSTQALAQPGAAGYDHT